MADGVALDLSARGAGGVAEGGTRRRDGVPVADAEQDEGLDGLRPAAGPGEGDFQTLLAEHASRGERALTEQLGWTIERRRPVKHLISSAHDRLTVSDAVGTWLEEFHHAVEHLVHDELPGRIPQQRFRAHAAAATFALEGAVTHGLDGATSRQLCDVLAAQLWRAGEATTV